MQKTLYYKSFIFILKNVCLTAVFVLLLIGNAMAQAGQVIKGTVTDAETKEQLAGVTVSVKGGTNKVATDVNGAYAITVPPGSVLVFYTIGYDRIEFTVTNQTSIDVKLKQSTTQLKDVMVTALGITKEKRAIGYSVSEVKGASITEVRENSFVNSLEGRVAGVNVSGVATGPNGASNVIIRGITNMTGNNQPLYVLNGIPLVNNNYATTDVGGGYGGKDGGDGIGDINPDDIETISILKGAAATALYGYRGSNGVVLITTKKGKSGEGLGVEINSNYVSENVIDETNFQTQYGQGYNGAKPVNAADALGSMESSWGAPLDGTKTFQFDGVKRPYSEAAKGNLGRFYHAGSNFTNTVAFSKGFGDDGATRFSVSDLYDQSYVPNAGLKRLTFNQTTNLKLAKSLTLDLSSQYVSEYTQNAPNVSDAVGNLNWGPMFVPPNINITTLAGPFGNGTMANGNELNPFADPYTTNPYFAAYQLQGAIHRNRFTGSANAKYTFDNGIFIGLAVADDYTSDRNTNIEPIGTGYLVDEGVNGDMYEQNVKQTELNIDLTTGKKIKFSKNFSTNLLFGVNYRKSVQEYFTASGQNFAIPLLYNIGNLENLTDNYSLNNEEFESVYASADLSYKDFLYLTVTGRNDWYSTLAPGKINYLYPSLSGSFVFSELLHIPALDLGKIRLSYADVGGAADNPYQTLQTYAIAGTLTITNGIFPIGTAGNGQVPNSALKPSSRREIEAGLEMDFFKNRLKFDLAVYQKKVIDDIVPVTIDYTSGYNSALLNVGTLRYNGLELAIGGTPVKSRDITWDIDFNASYTKGKVISLGGQPQITLGYEAQDWGSAAYTQQIVGKEPMQIIALDPARDSQGKIIIDPALGAPDPSLAQPKDYGSAENPWTGGINNSFHFGPVNLSFLIDGKFGGKLFSNTNLIAYQQGLSKLTLPGRDLLYGTNQQYASGYYGDWQAADQGMFVYDASFIKFRQLTLGYDFPVKKLFNNKIHGLKLSFVCHNVFTITKHTPNIDPESTYSASIYTQGLEAPAVPYSRTIGLNLNIKL
ncbi:SusC/RagA family TonB-linked outer membrane protein [Mucilaginibacter gotjawali]|uniref:TonB-dependent Receptor Plug Domain protein n=2 Tax=Mucilaginibacter gotjawali TaxID=1550579 RepID=A0A0X8X3N9_9SPHI|nr:SusC/RagA family TonB-linked outer membrane protein [Mucilaginibacter gotjawali]MBB3056394.1 TonB-linked SusC/RagA family outer membrane protein [Mucilaginibacter gotjawali]BAU55101.1 TonB-dependent Receptor Plug Domain protein [Mucilaginibacter gotjawali]